MHGLTTRPTKLDYIKARRSAVVVVNWYANDVRNLANCEHSNPSQKDFDLRKHLLRIYVERTLVDDAFAWHQVKT